MKNDNNVENVLLDDGVQKSLLKRNHKFENIETTNIDFLENELNFKKGDSWAVRVIYNDLFGGVIIKQNPGEGNRRHYHPDADECWVVLEGSYKWEIDGNTKIVNKGDIVLVKANSWHKITAVGNSPAARLAITRPDVNHVYED